MDPNSLKTMGAVAGAGGSDPVYIDQVFKTHLYDGTGSATSIVNGMDISGEGGLVWIKNRTHDSQHVIMDTERGAGNLIYMDADNAQSTGRTDLISSLNNNGFSIGGSDNYSNYSGRRYVSWTFLKHKKFFDIVTYTGTGSARTIAHSLGSVPGMIYIKKLSGAEGWAGYHRSLPNTKTSYPNYAVASDNGNDSWNSTTPTSTHFSLKTDGNVNYDGHTYVAYLFAHNDGDGDFGPNRNQDIIKCDSYTGNGNSTGPTVNLGWEPQFLIIKSSDSAEDWMMYDSMRGITYHSDGEKLIQNDTPNESTSDFFQLTSTGFKVTSSNNAINKNNDKYIYLAIRAAVGNMITPPDAGTDVFAMSAGAGSSTIPNFTSTFPVDFVTYRKPGTDHHWESGYRKLQGKYNYLNKTDTEGTWAPMVFDSNIGFQNHSIHGSDYQAWMWGRHAGFDVVGYTGTGSATTVTHSLSQVPEMIWVKSRGSAENWSIYHFGANGGTNPAHYFLELNTTEGENDNANFWNDTAPTSSVFSVGATTEVNDSSVNYISLLFSSVDNISKVGYYDGNSGTKTITTGFAPRFVMLKNTSSGAWSNWYVYDTLRGIPTGNDNYLMFNKNDDEEGGDDIIDVDGTSFTINVDWASHNSSSYSYIYYAHA